MLGAPAEEWDPGRILRHDEAPELNEVFSDCPDGYRRAFKSKHDRQMWYMHWNLANDAPKPSPAVKAEKAVTSKEVPPASTSRPQTGPFRVLRAKEEGRLGEVVSDCPDGVRRAFASKEERTQWYRLNDPSIPQEHREARDKSRAIWGEDVSPEERKENLTAYVISHLESAANPYDRVLDLYRYSTDYKYVKETRIASAVLDAFQLWLSNHPNAKQISETCLTYDVKAKAIDVAFNGPLFFLMPLIALFDVGQEVDGTPKICKAMEPEAQKKIETLAEKSKRLEALDLACFFGWYDTFDIHSFLVPLWLTGNQKKVESFLDHTKLRQLHFVSYLDKLLGKSDREREEYWAKMVAEGLGNNNEKPLQFKPLKSYIRKMVVRFHLDESAAPICKAESDKGQMRYNLNKFLKDQPRTFANRLQYYDQITGIIASGRSHYKFDLLVILLNMREEAEAFWWYVLLGMTRLPKDMEYKVEADPSVLERAAAEACYFPRFISPFKVAKFKEMLAEQASQKLPEELFAGYPLKLVDGLSLSLFRQMPEIFSQQSVIAIDAEWKQEFGKDKISLIQIACESAVYLVDIHVLPSLVDHKELTTFFEALFCGEAYKFGFDISQDINHIINTFPHQLEGLKERMQNVVCLKQLVNNLLDVDNKIVEMIDPNQRIPFDTYTTEDGEKKTDRNFSLAKLYNSVLNKTLDKTEQVSDWAKRPLRPKQVIYAAQDAYSLLEIYDELEKRCNARNIALPNVLYQCNPYKQKKRIKEKKLIDDHEEMAMLIKALEPHCYNEEEWKPVKSLKIIVDIMLNHLGKYLRRMGVDVLMASCKTTLHQMAVDDKNMDRIVLSAGRGFRQLCTEPKLAGRVRDLLARDKLENLAIELFRDMKVMPQMRDIFTRCVHCNKVGMVLVPRPIMHCMFSKHTADVFGLDTFDFAKWKELLGLGLAAEKYGGFGAEMHYGDSPSDVYAKVQDGVIDLGRRIVDCRALLGTAEIQIDMYGSTVFSLEEILFFYVCGGCGAFFWDGYGKKPHLAQQAAVAAQATLDQSRDADADTSVETALSIE
ncbi:unnamed protein product, partial [Mesorhabditis spiculigera]